jgi:hypothetical protein
VKSEMQPRPTLRLRGAIRNAPATVGVTSPARVEVIPAPAPRRSVVMHLPRLADAPTWLGGAKKKPGTISRRGGGRCWACGAARDTRSNPYWTAWLCQLAAIKRHASVLLTRAAGGVNGAKSLVSLPVWRFVLGLW